MIYIAQNIPFVPYNLLEWGSCNVKSDLPGMLKKKKYELPMKGANNGGEFPNVRPNPTAQ